MSGRPKRLADLSPITWCALVAGLTTVFCVLPSWIAHWAVLASVAGLVALPDEKRRAKANRIRKAMDICGYSLTTAARTADMDIGDFSRMLTGEKPLNDWRLEMLGDEFIRTLAFLEVQDRGLPEFARTAVQVDLALGAAKVSA